MNYYPAFGGHASAERFARFHQSPNFRQDKFVNQIPPTINMDAKFMVTAFVKGFFDKNPQRIPDKPLPVIPIDLSKLQNTDQTRIFWFGHSTILLETEGKKVLIDPMFSQRPSPVPMFGAERYSKTLPIEIEDLPPIDVVIISHDHYDHLDYDSIRKLKEKVRQFYVPLGIGSHLERWGIEKARIRELDWWQEANLEGLRFIAAPARHFSGRGFWDRDATLWCSWIVIGKQARIYFSGDSGYGPHFAQIGQKYGPFDLTLMECGQYDKRWADIHMMPAETVQAHIDVRGKIMIPIHWAAFSLSAHAWADPIEQVTRAANVQKICISTPKIGEPVVLGTKVYPNSIWWQSVLPTPIQREKDIVNRDFKFIGT